MLTVVFHRERGICGETSTGRDKGYFDPKVFRASKMQPYRRKAVGYAIRDNLD